MVKFSAPLSLTITIIVFGSFLVFPTSVETAGSCTCELTSTQSTDAGSTSSKTFFANNQSECAEAKSNPAILESKGVDTAIVTIGSCVYTAASTGDSSAGTPGGTVDFFSSDLQSDIKGLDQVNASLPELIGRLVKILMGVIGTIALVMFMYGGVMWMTASGNSDREGKALGTILWSALGIIVILASYALADLVFEAFR